MPFQPGSDDASSFFQKGAVGFREGGRGVAIDVDFADNAAISADRDNDLGFCTDGAGKIARIGVYVVHDDGFTGGYRCATNSLTDGNAEVRGGLANEGAEDQGLRVGGIEHIEAGPIVMREFGGDGRDDGFLEGIERGRGRGQFADAGEQGEHLRGEGGNVHLYF